MGQFYYRMDNFLMMLAGEPERAHRFLDALMEIHMRNLDSFLGAVGDSIDIILFGDDLGAQNSPQISPRMYREFFKPRHAMMWARAKQLANAKVMLHCCGAVRPLFPDLIDAGLDAINPVQISCRGMEAEGLKRDFGTRPHFLGRWLRYAKHFAPRALPPKCARTYSTNVKRLRPAAVSSSNRCTTSWPMYPLKISSPCTTQCTSTTQRKGISTANS